MPFHMAHSTEPSPHRIEAPVPQTPAASRMPPWGIVAAGIVLFVGVLGLLFGAMTVFSPPPGTGPARGLQSQHLADGTILVLEKVTMGPPDPSLRCALDGNCRGAVSLDNGLDESLRRGDRQIA
jgi:hypothetical protein